MINNSIIKKSLKSHIDQILNLIFNNNNKVFIHVGLHKCASTSLQFYWKSSKIKNLIYFKEVYLIEKFVTSPINEKTLQNGISLLKILIDNYLAKKKNSIVIISSEFLLKSATKKNYHQRVDLLSIFSSFAQYILIRKNEEDYVKSIYWQFLKTGRYVNSVENFLNENPDAKIDVYFKKMMNYFANSIEKSSNIHLFNLDGFSHSEQIENYINIKLFSQYLDVYASSKKVTKNKSPSKENVLKIQKIINFFFSTPLASEKKLEWSRFSDVPVKNKFYYLRVRFTLKELIYIIFVNILIFLINEKKVISVKKEAYRNINKYEIF